MMVDNDKYYDLQDDDRTDEQLAQDEEIMTALASQHLFEAKQDNIKYCEVCNKHVTDDSHYYVPAFLKQDQAI